jgi:hypothetical protein
MNEETFEQSLKSHLKRKPRKRFKNSNKALIKQVLTTSNYQQGSKDVVGLGFASIWIVFTNLFLSIFKPFLTQKSAKNTTVSQSEQSK